MRRWLAFGLAVWLGTAGLLMSFPPPALAQDGATLGDAPVLQDGMVIAASADDIVQAAAVPAVDISSRSASAAFYYSYYTSQPAIGWTGSQASCTAGTTSAAFKAAVIDRVAFYRAMAGVPSSVGLSATSSTSNQQAALMFSRNGQLSHSPPSSWACYTSAGAQAAGSSNIALGTYGVGAIDAYMRDAGGNNTAAGHRRWILYPQTQSFGTGDVTASGQYASANSLWVWDSNVSGPRPSTRDGYVAWPPPGYVPYQVVFSRWTFSYPGAGFGDASVSVTSNGSSLPVSIDSSTSNGYGENTIVFRLNGMGDGASWPNPGTDKTYTVRITGVSVGGQSRTYTYDVKIFDPASGDPGSGTSTATASPSATRTATATATRTASATVTRTATASATASRTTTPVPPSATATASRTSTPVPPSATRTLSPSPTSTTLGATAAPTQTPSRTPSRTATALPATSTATTAPGGYAVGDSFRLTANVSLRVGPGTSYGRTTTVPSGTMGTVVGDPVSADGYTFYRVTFPVYGTGWVAGEFFEPVSTGTATSTAVPPTLTRTATSVAASATRTSTSAAASATRTSTTVAASATSTTAASTATQTATSVPPSATRTATTASQPTVTSGPGGFAIGDTVRTTTSVNLRSGPSTSAGVVAVVPSNRTGTITGSGVVNGSNTFYPVTISGYGSGWIAGQYLAKVSSSSSPTATTVSGFPTGSTVYTTTGVNVRSGPGTGYASRGIAVKGTSATVTGSPTLVGSVSWYPLNVTGIGAGWVSGAYLSATPTVLGPLWQEPTSTNEPATGDTDAENMEATQPPAIEEPSEPTVIEPTEAPADTPAETALPSPTATIVDVLTPTEIPAATEVPAEDNSDVAEEEAPTEEIAIEPTAAPASVWVEIARIQRSTDSQPGQVLVDNDPATVWFANGAGQPLAMFVLDLGQVTSFSQIQWQTGESGQSGTLYLSVSSDNVTWTDLDPTLAAITEEGWVVMDAGATAQFVRFVFVNDAGAEWLGGFAEVRLAP